MAAPPKDQLSASTINDVLGVLALRAGSPTETPGMVKPKKGDSLASATTTVPGNSVLGAGKPKKRKQEDHKECPSGAAGSDGTVDGRPIYTWGEFDQLKHDFQLSDEEASQILTDLCGPRETHVGEPEEEVPTKKKDKKKKKSEKTEETKQEKKEKKDEEEPKAKKPKKKKKEQPESEEEKRPRQVRSAPHVEELVSPDAPEVLELPEETPVLKLPDEKQPVVKRRRQTKSAPEEGPLPKMFCADTY